MEKITANYSVVTPAYGRDYKSEKDAIAEFKSGLDFIYQGFDGSGYCSMRDFASGVKVNIRYGRLLKVTTVTVP